MSEEYNWDKSIFEKAYQEVVESKFAFSIDYPTKLSRDKKKVANLRIEKNETITSGYVMIHIGASISKIKLFDKKNWWWYDGAYLLAKHAKWLDTDKFGISYAKGALEIWYSIEQNDVSFLEFGAEVKKIDFGRFFRLEGY